MYNSSADKAARKYKAAHIRRIVLDVQLSEYDRIKAAADAAGLPVNTWIKQAIRAALGDSSGSAAGDHAQAVPGTGGGESQGPDFPG